MRHGQVGTGWLCFCELALLLCLACLLGGCDLPLLEAQGANPATTSSDEATHENAAHESTSSQAPSQEVDVQPRALVEPLSPTSWDEHESPNYYRVVGPASIVASLEPGTVVYGELDDLGRTTGVAAAITYAQMEEGTARERGETGQIRPVGWEHNAEASMAMPDGSVYRGQFYNRSHLLAKSLGGDDEAHNLMMGTRTQNVGANVNGSEGGMAYGESLVRAWLKGHPQGTILYVAIPLYEGDELVARSVAVSIRASDGSLDQRVEVYNAARGFSIDYATGTFEATEDPAEAAADIRARQGIDEGTQDAQATESATTPVVVQGSPEGEHGERKVIVTGSGKAYHHDENCRGLANARSMSWVSVSEAEEMGRHPCGICGG